jgi:hypothetical protein
MDFLLGDGQAPPTTNLRWETFLHGVMTGTGLQTGITKGTIVGWTDVGGFDELRVAAASSSSDPGFGNMQAIAIDDLRAQLITPEPSSIVLFALGLNGLAVFGLWKRRRRNASEVTA